MKIKKKQTIILGAVAAAAVIAGGIFAMTREGGSSKGDPDSTVYVDSVADLCGLGSGNGLNNRFAGVVEPQRTWKIEVSGDKKVDEVLVQEGDEVKAGDKLFTYNIEEMEENLAQAEIDIDRLVNEIEQTKEQIASLKKEKANASADAQLSYTTQINTAENEIKRKEYEQKSKKMEIEKLKNSIANATVTSEMDGLVKSINANGDSAGEMMMGGESEPFMTILATGDFRIKGTVNEQNMSSIVEGEAVLVHSRVDDTIWRGTMTSVDIENPEKSDNMYYGMSDGGAENSSKYPFYVELESAEGLMLGQHVYIEMDHGQEEPKEGLWLDSYYIIQEEEDAYVWAADSKDRIEKRSVTLGDFDEELQKYQIVDGLTEEDYIAFPDESIAEGDTAVKNIDQAGGMENTGGMQDMGGSDVPAFDAEEDGGSQPADGDDSYLDDDDDFPSDDGEEGGISDDGSLGENIGDMDVSGVLGGMEGEE